MYRNGLFTNLLWTQKYVESYHRPRWTMLEAAYGFRCIPPLDPTHTKDDFLYNIASACVSQCGDLLFSLIPIEMLNLPYAETHKVSDFSPIVRNAMATRLHDSLCMHLIITFTYRFLCENLRPKKFNDYCDVFFTCQNSIAADNRLRGSKLDVRDKKCDYRKVQREKYSSFCNELGISSTQSIQPSLLDELYKITSNKQTVNSLEEYLTDEVSIDQIAPPSAWFLLFYISQRIRHRKALSDSSKDRFLSFSELISSSEEAKILIEESEAADKITIASPHSQRMVLYGDYHGTFTCIPFDTNLRDVRPIPDLSYQLRTNNQSITISSNLQRVFNIYLLERNFHLHALTTAEFCARKFCDLAENRQTVAEVLSMPTKIHAPFVHGDFISFINDYVEVQSNPALIEQYIYRWNRYALPALEELFIGHMWNYVKDPIEIVSAVEGWIKSDNVYSNLRIIRGLYAESINSRKAHNPSPLQKEEKKMHNKLVDCIFSIGNY